MSSPAVPLDQNSITLPFFFVGFFVDLPGVARSSGDVDVPPGSELRLAGTVVVRAGGAWVVVERVVVVWLRGLVVVGSGD